MDKDKQLLIESTEMVSLITMVNHETLIMQARNRIREMNGEKPEYINESDLYRTLQKKHIEFVTNWKTWEPILFKETEKDVDDPDIEARMMQ